MSALPPIDRSVPVRVTEPGEGGGSSLRRGLGTLASQGLRQGRRLVILVVGMTLLIFGALLLVLPGPGIPIAIGGLALLAVEFAWARRWLRRGRVTGKVVKRSVLRRWAARRAGATAEPEDAGSGEESDPPLR